jgi:hypothetical protein
VWERGRVRGIKMEIIKLGLISPTSSSSLSMERDSIL